MQTTELQREFKYNSVKLADPNPAFSLVQVRDFFANVYPEIISADIEGPEMIGNKQVYSFRRAVGTKGVTVAVMHYIGDAAPASAPALQHVAKMVHDLADLEQIGWFYSEPRTANFIRITAEFVTDNPNFLLSDMHQARVRELHVANCRIRSDAA